MRIDEALRERKQIKAGELVAKRSEVEVVRKLIRTDDALTRLVHVIAPGQTRYATRGRGGYMNSQTSS